jgi:hypothetical protein
VQNLKPQWRPAKWQKRLAYLSLISAAILVQFAFARLLFDAKQAQNATYFVAWLLLVMASDAAGIIFYYFLVSHRLKFDHRKKFLWRRAS